MKTWFPIRTGLFKPTRYLRAVDGVEFDIPKGRTLGLVGESGSGKTTVGRTILRLVPAHAGRVRFDGTDLLTLGDRQMLPFRRRMQIIFQDPMLSLNPRMTVASIIAEPLLVHTSLSRRERKARIAELLSQVGMQPDYMRRYPHEFSGGQRQRIGIARALASNPDFIVCDEPVSALDVSVQAQILNLMNDLQDQMGLTFLFIAHNLAVVEYFSDEVAVMYQGKILERADRDELYANPLHPYTQTLFSAIPRMTVEKRKAPPADPGEPPTFAARAQGCAYHPRCHQAQSQCRTTPPELTHVADNHWVRCWK
ncbi:MAG: ABC transporter ATP-binding protein [Desulfatitalea sp.]|nr:ABC transporter ATP-binding protein [Desulfatitalea sp.]NNK01775.1 ABC transporter ATP-binding protein [Desulfatitalea sp.]